MSETQGVAPLTPELTYSTQPGGTRFPLDSGGSKSRLRVDHSFRDEMWGEPTDPIPARLTKISDRSDHQHRTSPGISPDGSADRQRFTVSNVSDERYDQCGA